MLVQTSRYMCIMLINIGQYRIIMIVISHSESVYVYVLARAEMRGRWLHCSWFGHCGCTWAINGMALAGVGWPTLIWANDCDSPYLLNQCCA